MFKNASQSSQLRAVNRVLQSTQNDSGIDPSVWKKEDADLLNAEYEDLVSQKQDLQLLASNVRAQISLAACQRREIGRSLSSATWANLQQQNVDLKSRMVALDKKITLIKRKLRTATEWDANKREAERQNSFEFAFFTMAKEMLSDPVFNRITTAALHRLSITKGE